MTRRLLTQNVKMRRDQTWNWTLPAWVVTRVDGRPVNVCPQAGACAKLCYARNGTYNFPSVRAAHLRNLERTLVDLPGWTDDMLAELSHRRHRPTGTPHLPELGRDHLSADVAELLDVGAACVRIHDAGDFHSEDYLKAWLTIAARVPDVLFYTYTKEVALLQRVVGAHGRRNFLHCYSMGGRQDHLVDRDRDRHADVFPDATALAAAGYYSQDAHDLLCVVAPSRRIGIPANNIPAFRRRMGPRTFAQLEAGTRRRRAPAR